MKDSKFHIVITDNESGETVLDVDTCAFIGGLVTGEDETQGIILSSCSNLELARAVTTAKTSVQTVLEKKNDVMFALALHLIEKSTKVGETIDRSEGGAEE